MNDNNSNNNNSKFSNINPLCNNKSNGNNNINSLNKLTINPINNNSNIGNIINNYQHFNYFQYLYSIYNYNNMELNKELQKVKEIPLKNRDFLYRDEKVSEEENEFTEYKNYTYPFNQEKIDELKRQYCGFLNSKGGRIFIGITESCIVKGLFLDYKARDIIKNDLINLTYDFCPKCRLDKISIYYIPVNSLINNKNIEGLCVIKIIIMPGELYNLYSISNKGGFISTLRLPGQCINLTAEEIHEEIIKRNELYKKRIIIEKKESKEIVNNKENINNENINNNIILNNLDSDMSEELEEIIDLKPENNTNNININDIKLIPKRDKRRRKRPIYIVEISNIDTSLIIKDINRFFNGCGGSLQRFPAYDNGKSKGYGEIHFTRKETAKATIIY